MTDDPMLGPTTVSTYDVLRGMVEAFDANTPGYRLALSRDGREVRRIFAVTEGLIGIDYGDACEFLSPQLLSVTAHVVPLNPAAPRRIGFEPWRPDLLGELSK
jgi:hypothetical protein